MGRAQQEGAIFGIAGLVEAEHGELVAGGGGAAVQEMLDRAAEGIGNAADIFPELTRAIGFPLGDSAAAHVAGGGQGILGESSGATQFTNPHAYAGGRLFHGVSMGEYF
jgi:hypothetical protein